MSGPLSGKVAIITGGTKGIGFSVAQHLVSLGVYVVASYEKDAAAAKAFTEAIGPTKGTAIQADGGSLAGVDTLIQATTEKHKQIDFLILNAGIFQPVEIDTLTEEFFDKSFNVNVKGPMFLVQKALPYMPPGSRIVFVSTTQNFTSTVTAPYLLYCATKGAVDQMTRLLAKDLAAKKGINVNCIAPGPTATNTLLEGKSAATLNEIAGLNPFNRIGDPEEVAAPFAFLVGPKSKWVNGQIIKVNGGQYVG